MQLTGKVSPPSRKELFALRLMIFIGAGSMAWFLYCLLDPGQIGYAPFYWILMAGIFFNCLKILHEWYHYLHITVPPTPPAIRNFTVDIFTTFCPGEPYEMIVETLTAVQAIRYPHTTYLCDEANDPYLKEVCRQLGVRHITRNNRKDAKAGNINNALQYASGELCVVLDPDHVPAPDLLDPIVPHFNDDRIGFVQIVQAYSNLGDSMIAKGAGQQTFQFYGPMMMTMNRYGTVLAIGANCTFRRKALDAIGGHAAGLAEDMHTAMQLHAKGWRSVYVPAVLTRGLVPVTLSAYYKQQLKWARGTFELLVTTFPRLFRHFTWRQRLHYATIPFHYFSGVIFFINFLIPILSLSMGLIPLKVDLQSFILLGLPFVSATLLIRHFVQRWVMEEGERGFHVVGGLLLIGTWWIYILGLCYTLVRRKVPYIPTPKDGNEADNWQLNLPNIAVAAASLAAIGYGLYLDWTPYAWIMGGIAAMNCGIMLFNVIASRRSDLLRFRNRYTMVEAALVYPVQLKKQFWIFRHRIYTVMRELALPLLLLISAATGYLLIRDAQIPMQAFRQPPVITGRMPGRYPATPHSTAAKSLPWLDTIRGIHYQKGYDWYRNYHTLSRRELIRDMEAMRQLGINTIRRYGPGVYDHNLLAAARHYGMQVHYGFWAPEQADVTASRQLLAEWGHRVMATVERLKHNRQIVAWHIGNVALYQRLPEGVAWLRALTGQIRAIDPQRPLTMDVNADTNVNATTQWLRHELPAVSAFGLVVTKDTAGLSQAAQLPVPWFVSQAGLPQYKYLLHRGGVFINAWQDLETRDYVTFDGLTDHWGRRKPGWYELGGYWNDAVAPPRLPSVKILRAAKATYPGDRLTYYALTGKNGQWAFPGARSLLRFEWYLVKTDGWGHAIFMKHLGEGEKITVTIPSEPATYLLYLCGSKDGDVVTTQSILSTPL